jgi:hypothetical protein
MKNCKMFLVLLLFIAACSSGVSQDNSVVTSESAGHGLSVFGQLEGFANAQTIKQGDGFQLLDGDAEKSVTHVVAAPCSDASQENLVISEVDLDGSFSLVIPTGEPWVLFFADTTMLGNEMIVGTLKFSSMDTVASTGVEGLLNLNAISVVGGVATSEISYDEFIAVLGLSEEEASTIGNLDDVCLAKTNIDANADGVIDANQQVGVVSVYFNVSYDFLADGVKMMPLDTLKGGLLDTANYLGFAYTSAGLNFLFPNDYSESDQISASFPESEITTIDGVVYDAGETVDELSRNAWSNNIMSSLSVAPNTPLPVGEYNLYLGDEKITFTNINPPSLEENRTTSGQIFPFIRFILDDPECELACTIKKVGYRWMKKTASGWELAEQNELQLVVSDHAGYFNFRRAALPYQEFGLTIPKDSVEGVVDWGAGSVNLMCMQSDELSSVTVEEVCYATLSYDDNFGTRHMINFDGCPVEKMHLKFEKHLNVPCSFSPGGVSAEEDPLSNCLIECARGWARCLNSANSAFDECVKKAKEKKSRFENISRDFVAWLFDIYSATPYEEALELCFKAHALGYRLCDDVHEDCVQDCFEAHPPPPPDDPDDCETPILEMPEC